MTDKEGNEGIFFAEFRFASFQIGFDFFCSQIRQVDGTDFSSFSANTKLTCIQINSRFIECREFRDTQTCGINTFNNCCVAFSLNRCCIDLVKYSHDFGSIKKSYFTIFLFDEIDRDRIDGFVSRFPTELQKSPKSDHIRIRRFYGESLFRYTKPKLI